MEETCWSSFITLDLVLHACMIMLTIIMYGRSMNDNANHNHAWRKHWSNVVMSFAWTVDCPRSVLSPVLLPLFLLGISVSLILFYWYHSPFRAFYRFKWWVIVRVIISQSCLLIQRYSCYKALWLDGLTNKVVISLVVEIAPCLCVMKWWLLTLHGL